MDDILTPIILKYMCTHREKDNIFFSLAKQTINKFNFDDVVFSKKMEKVISNMKPGSRGYLCCLYKVIYYASEEIRALGTEDIERCSFTGTKYVLYDQPTDPRYYYLQKMYIQLSPYTSEYCKADPFLKKA